MCLAVPGKVETVFVEHDVRMGRVDFGGVGKTVCLECVAGVQAGDYVLVHAGFAITRIDPVAAEKSLEEFERLGDLAGLEPTLGSGAGLPGGEAQGADGGQSGGQFERGGDDIDEVSG